MKKILFVDHHFHKKTRSADFFVDILRTGFCVEIYYLSPEDQPDTGVLAAAGAVDVVVLWQMDFLAPVFLSMGKPVIVIPMFDGSGGMPDIHWMFAHKARFFNFCLVLNERVRMAGCETMLLRYFPEPADEDDLPRFDELHAFFWQRRPDHGIDFKMVDTLIGQELDSLHVHNVADIKGNFTPTPHLNAPYKFSQSTWFKNKSEYAQFVRRANVFVAPRVAEGIGMALLEAMANGKLVLAHSAPTNSEYISNWSNGILFNKDQVSPISIRGAAAQMARLGWRTVVEGHKQWVAARPAILEWVDQTEAGAAIEMNYASFFKDLWFSYYASLDEYVLFLSRNLALLSQITDLHFDKLLDVIGDAQPQPIALLSTLRDCELDADGLLDLTREDDRFIGKGWSNAEPDWRWALGYRSELYFAGLDIIQGRIKGHFIASSLRNLGRWVQCTILLNGKVVFDGRVTPDWSHYRFVFDADLLQDENHLVLCFDKATTLPTDSRALSVCFKHFDFSPG
ncbi:glycosyltransferase, group 1 family protein [Novosphingobium sp. Rr 2-17]|uniref:glycosyltransferase n=1 Tax=Novosphingobium sp. Rr 2-17 TaxID=555793 RepID=UPI000269A79A|nr:glycosyltransferase [Novosphingobium sp. Rr 2-17]EIZ80796.1 glycosyltransferase, group 1 family protein [Novosphingobium sp. Rr 2-17]